MSGPDKPRATLQRLAPCPSSPNCVSTLSTSDQHQIAPYRYRGTLAEAKRRLKEVVAAQRGSKIVEEDQTYLHAEFTSRIFRFVDDVEFVFEDETRTIHFRSASRIGYSDFGANRNRMEEIRRLLEGNL
ncbi:MAG: DUF1499 domain-containing protein [Nitrospiraceae bacterium]